MEEGGAVTLPSGFARGPSWGWRSRHLVSHPEPGEWTVEVDGTALASPMWGRMMAFGTSNVKMKTDVPRVIRPGEPVPLLAQVQDWDSLLTEPPTITFRITRPGDLFAVGNRVVDSPMTATPVTDGLTNYSHMLTVGDVEGRIPYRFLLSGKDKQGNPVSREASGDFFVKGDEPVIIPLTSAFDEPTEYPTISAIIADDVALKDFAIKVDGSTIYPVQVTTLTVQQATAMLSARGVDASAVAGKRDIRLVSATTTWPLAQGAHTAEVTASDTIAQAAAPEVWTIRVGRSLVASDSAGGR